VENTDFGSTFFSSSSTISFPIAIPSLLWEVWPDHTEKIGQSPPLSVALPCGSSWTIAASCPVGSSIYGRPITSRAIDFNRPVKLTDNCFVETFNGSLPDECLNDHWFDTIDDAKAKIEAWRAEYNESRPHQALAEMTPAAYALKCRALRLGTEPLAAEG
jgi:hypothetical protein